MEYYHITTLPHYHITTLPHYYITTLPLYHITIDEESSPNRKPVNANNNSKVKIWWTWSLLISWRGEIKEVMENLCALKKEFTFSTRQKTNILFQKKSMVLFYQSNHLMKSILVAISSLVLLLGSPHKR